jgi:DNA-binding PadR family transcriptional regulator
MTRRFSAQAVSVLAALCAEPSRWRHGYDLASETGLRAGTLYPILSRLADRGLLEACWEQEQPAGRPRRHMYRLSGDGLAQARAAVAGAPALARKAQRRTAERRATAPGRSGLAGEGA